MVNNVYSILWTYNFLKMYHIIVLCLTIRFIGTNNKAIKIDRKKCPITVIIIRSHIIINSIVKSTITLYINTSGWSGFCL